MSNTVSKYTIQLDIEKSDNIAKNIDEIERAFKELSDGAKNINVSDGLKQASNQADLLSKKMKDIVENSEDATSALKAYDKAAQKSINDLEKQYIKLNYSLSEQGTEQRKQLSLLREQAKALEGNNSRKKEYNAIVKQIKSIEKDVVDLSDDDLKSAMRENREIRARLKFTQQESRIAAAQRKQQGELAKLIKADINAIKEKIKQQLKFIQALKTTEGRYNAIKKAAGKIGAGAISAGKGLGIVGGASMALGGAAIASADREVEREKQARRIKGGFDDDLKKEILSDLYIKTGADYSTIVDAINRVQSVLGKDADKYDLLEAVPVELKYPGASAIFRQDNTRFIHSGSFTQYENRIKAIQGATGASTDQVEASTQKIANMRQSSFSNASMSELQALYLGLQNSGAYDTQEELDRAFNVFVRAQRGQKKSVFEFAQSYNWARGVYGGSNRQQALKAISNLNFGAIEQSTKVVDNEQRRTTAENAAIRARQMEEQKNKILSKILEAVFPVFEKIDTTKITQVLNGLIDFATKLIPPMVEIMNAILPYIDKLIGFVSYGIETAKGLISGQPGMARANGGIVTMPSLCGESGAEMVIPIDHSRVARASNLTQYYNQTFSMNGNETTALSLSSLVRSRDFSRALSSNISMNARLGR
jgi:hypothetical protein